ncbi:YebC/PmpR family DNA-binding transcriptional regulator [Oceanispirochaeta sp.]|jgi:YebC/PmpR family DNA-binding regulatory protein|uniref:YebC/PmpR family DNA-binding transcriptional regulator n=1 Tax=Oceanispirochaeta sp. TaxID=2035350 RepID=UPI00261B9243|nr:YebC/PmpR family DNA-binding transcriptional regulator [Oceanispirochaeta sp.]MDA3957732.1 YebC/PmpR family DNA-binding transcriptional regulator [Oceanispirochaeta sp.]
MSGHSKWASIKHKKGALDAKRGKLFTKIIKEINVSARMGGGDIETNAGLRTVVLKAKAANMPKDNIDKAIKKGIGGMDGVDYVELQYEAYAPGGVGLLISALTDNKNRTAADVRSILNKGGGSLATTGAVSYQFARKGVIAYDGEDVDFEALFEAALEAGAEDVTNDDGAIEVLTDTADFEAVLTALQDAGFNQISAEITMVSDTNVTLDHEHTGKVLRLIDRLEDNDDVQNVASNLDIPADFEMEE